MNQKIDVELADVAREAIQLAVAYGATNVSELKTADQAAKQESPIALERTRRALANALAEFGRDGKNTPDLMALYQRLVIDPDEIQRGLAHVHLRVPFPVKATWVRMARAEGKPLGDWMVSKLPPAE